MTIINDPDNLDRFQVIVDSYYKILSLRGSGGIAGAAVGGAQGSAGSGLANGKFSDYQSNTAAAFDGVFGDATSGNILAVVNDPDNDGGVMGHYRIVSKDNNNVITLDRNISKTTASGISYRIFVDGEQNQADPALADGVTMQCLYSFLKEEWRDNTLSASGEDLIKYTFPMVSITSEQFEIGGVSNSNWEFADDTGDGPLAAESTRNLIRTGGWASLNDQGQIIENYPGIITLGTLESDSQVYYQLTNATTNPDNFVLTGPVNQSIRTLETIGGASTTGNKVPVNQVADASVSFSSTYPNMTFTSDMFAAGFVSGELIQIRGTQDNNGLFTIVSSGNNATEIGVSETVITEAGVTTCLASPMTDNRDYLVLRVRTKAKSYGQSEIADIGVSQINTIVNRFPLAETDDPAIVLDDGAINGDGTNVAFQATTNVTTDTDGVTSDNGDGTFTLSDTGIEASLVVGDTVAITAATTSTNIGVYEISGIAAGVLTCINEPTRGAITSEGGNTYQTRTRVRQDSQAGTLTDSGGEVASGGTVTLNDVGAFASALVGDIVVIETATPEIQGFYRVSEVTDNDNIKLDVKVTNSDDADAPYDSVPLGNTNPFTGLSAEGVNYSLLQAGMHLSYKNITATQVTGASASANVLTSAAGELQKADGYYVGTYVTISGTTNSTDGTYLITATTDDNDITLANISDPSTTPTITGASITINGTTGFIRKIGDYEYNFNWKLYGNDGTLGECFQFLQKQLRLAGDIDEGDDDVNGIFRGDITDLLMNFASPNGTTLNLFIDSLNGAESNNITLQDQNGTNQTNPFIVALRIAVNNNILNAATNKIVVFFTDSNGTPGDGDEFGTTGAVIVQQGQGAAGGDMVETDFRTALGDSSPITFQYDYDANDPGATNKGVTIVCITDDTGQYVQTTATLSRSNTVDASLVAGLERNYSNP
jgi:hypothetical protein